MPWPIGTVRRGARGLLAGLICCAFWAAPAAADWPEQLDGHGGPVQGIAFADESGAALTASFDYSVILWSLEGEAPEIRHRLLGHDAAVNDVAFRPGAGQALSASDDGTIALWDLEDGELLERFSAGGDRVFDVTISEDGRLAASAGWDRTARLWDLEAREAGAVMEGHDGPVNAVILSPDASRLYTASQDGTIRSWDAETGAPLRRIHHHGWGVNVLLMVSGGEELLFGAVDGSVHVIDIESGETLRELGQHDGPVLAAAADAAEEMAVVSGADGHMRVYRLADWTMQHDHHNPYGPIWAVAFTPDGRMVYHGGLDDYVIGLQIDPRQRFEAAAGDFPRRFQLTGDMDLGERQFVRKCSVCHTLTPDGANRAGPTLYGVFGRQAGTLSGYDYSDALKESDIVWNEETIAELFDHGPDVVTPGTKMPIQRLRDEEERTALVAFLKEATDAEEEEEADAPH